MEFEDNYSQVSPLQATIPNLLRPGEDDSDGFHTGFPTSQYDIPTVGILSHLS